MACSRLPMFNTDPRIKISFHFYQTAEDCSGSKSAKSRKIVATASSSHSTDSITSLFHSCSLSQIRHCPAESKPTIRCVRWNQPNFSASFSMPINADLRTNR